MTTFDPRLAKLEQEWNDTIEQIEELKVRASEAEDQTLTDEEQAQYDALCARAEEIKPQLLKLRKQDDLVSSLARQITDTATNTDDQKHRSRIKEGEYFFHFIRATHPDAATHYPDSVQLFRDATLQDSNDSAGLLPFTVAGDIIRFVDARRHTIETLTYYALPAGASFRRRVETGASGFDLQGSEGAEVTTASFPQVNYVEVNHSTYAGGARLSLQAIEFTDPSLADLNQRSLAEQVAIKTDTVVAEALWNAAAQNAEVAFVADSDCTPREVIQAINTASNQIYAASKSKPNAIWVDPYTRAFLGEIVGTDGHFAFPTVNPSNRAGFGGTSVEWDGLVINGLPVNVSPNFPQATFIVGNNKYGEVYEQNYGLKGGWNILNLTYDIALAVELGTYFRSEGFRHIGVSEMATPSN